MSKTSDALVGKYFIADSPNHETYCLGRVVGVCNNGFAYLLEFEAHGGVAGMELATLREITALCNHGSKLWRFFPSREEQHKYIAWMNEPEPKRKGHKAKVIDLNSKR